MTYNVFGEMFMFNTTLPRHTSSLFNVLCVRVVRDRLSLADSDDRSPRTSAAKSPYLPLTPDTPTSSPLFRPISVSASDIQCRGSSVTSLPSVGVGDKRKHSSSSHGHTRHRSVDFALADMVPDLSETIDTDFLHAARSLCLRVVLFYRNRKTICNVHKVNE